MDVRSHLSAERGFTLIEILVVVLIIGVLAAIAIPVFLGQRSKADDADAKSNARNIYAQVESCGTEAGGDYTDCTTAEQLGERSHPDRQCRRPDRGHRHGSGRLHDHGVLEVGQDVRHHEVPRRPRADRRRQRRRHLVAKTPTPAPDRSSRWPE